MTLVGRAIDCNTPMSESRRQLAVAEATKSLVGRYRSLHLEPRVCAAALGVAKKSEPAMPRLRGMTPLLFISGDLDANAPPFYAEQLRWGFPRSRNVIIANAFHETLPSPDVQRVVYEFLAGNDIGAPAIAFEPPKALTVDEARIAVTRRRR